MKVKRALAAMAAILATGAGAALAQTPAAPKPPAGAEAPRPQRAEGVAAVVNDEVISTFDVRQRGALILASSGIEPTAESFQQVRAQALRALVDERLQLQEAKEYEIEVDEKEVDAALADIARSNGATVDQLRAQLAAAGSGLATLRSQLKADIAWRRLIGGRYGSRVRISNGQIEETLSRIAASATKPQYQVSEIFLAGESEKELADAETAAARLLEEMRKGASFSLVARQFSSAPSAAAGGDLGWLSEGELRPEIQAAVDVLAAGQVSNPIRAPGGVYIIAVRDKRPGVDASTVTRVTLKQISAASAQRAALDRARRRIRNCDGVDSAISGVSGAEAVDLGEVGEAELAAGMIERVRETPAGQASAVFDSAEGRVATVVVCARDTAGGALPSRDQIEDRLYEQELAMLSERYLRNLRRESTIITR